MTTVAILGCGPAGMFAAHACAQNGIEPDIFSKNRKSHMHGAQYLQDEIPGLTGDPFEVKTMLRGTLEGYRDKVYRDPSYVPGKLNHGMEGYFKAWDIREAYDRAWDRYSRFIQDVDLAANPWMLDVIESKYDIIVSTIPAPLLCRDPAHHFESAWIWSTDYIKAEQSEFQGPGDTWLDNIVVYSGAPDDWWVRQSRIHGWENTEFPHDREPKGYQGKVFEVEKPLSTTCDCFPEFIREGRYGRWEKGVLSHEGYTHTMEHLQKVNAR